MEFKKQTQEERILYLNSKATANEPMNPMLSLKKKKKNLISLIKKVIFFISLFTKNVNTMWLILSVREK